MMIIQPEEDKVVSDFSEWLRLRKFAEATRTAYSADTRKLMAQLTEKGIHLNKIDGRIIADCVLYTVHGKKLASSTVRRRLSSALTLVSFLRESGRDIELIEISKLKKTAVGRAAHLGIYLNERKHACRINDEEFSRLTDVIEKGNKSRDSAEYFIARDLLLANLFYRAGARAEEAAELMFGDLNCKDGDEFTVLLGREKREVGFRVRKEQGLGCIANYPLYLAEFIGKETDSGNRLVLNKYGEGMNSRSIRRHFNAYGKAALEIAISPRDLRASHIDSLLNAGDSYREIAKRLGIVNAGSVSQIYAPKKIGNKK